MDKLKRLKDVYERGLITKERYDSKRLEIIDKEMGMTPTVPPITTQGSEATSTSPRKITDKSNKSPRETSPRTVGTVTAKPRPSRRRGNTGGKGSTSPRNTATSPRTTSPRNKSKFDVNMPVLSPTEQQAQRPNAAHMRYPMPQPPRGKVGTKFQMPSGTMEIKTVQVYEKPTLWLGPESVVGVSNFDTQVDVREKTVIGTGTPTNRSDSSQNNTALPHGIAVGTVGLMSFHEVMGLTANVLDLIEQCLKRIKLEHGAKQFGIIQKIGGQDSWLSPDTLCAELEDMDIILTLVPKEMCDDALKSMYMKRVTSSSGSSDPANLGAQFYYQE